MLARYDGQRPLAPWLIRVFQNWHLSKLRQSSGVSALPDEEVAMPMEPVATATTRPAAGTRSFVQAARDWLGSIDDEERLLLGLRWRYRMSQREAAKLFGLNEGTLTRRTDKLRDRALEQIGGRLVAEGWTGDDLDELRADGARRHPDRRSAPVGRPPRPPPRREGQDVGGREFVKQPSDRFGRSLGCFWLADRLISDCPAEFLDFLAEAIEPLQDLLLRDLARIGLDGAGANFDAPFDFDLAPPFLLDVSLCFSRPQSRFAFDDRRGGFSRRGFFAVCRSVP